MTLRHLTLLACVPILFISETQAQTPVPSLGSRSNGIGNIVSCARDEWFVFNNAGCIPSTNKPIASVTYKIIPGLPSINQLAGLIASPVSNHATIGFGYYRIGDELYSEQQACLTLGNTMGHTSLGLRLSLVQLRADGFGSRLVVSTGFGGITRVTERISVAAHINHINQPYMTEERNQRLNATMAVGISFLVTGKSTVYAEVEKLITQPLLWKVGLEFSPLDKVFLRTGINLKPNNFFIGLGLAQQRLTFDYAFQYGNLLGSLHQVSLGYLLKR